MKMLGLSLFFVGLVSISCSDGSSSSSSASSSGSSGAQCTDYAVPASTDLKVPVVSFSKDVVPIFRTACAFATCHGAQTGQNQGLYLGSEAAKVHAGIVGVKARVLPTANYVTASAPKESFLMRKADGDHCTLAAQCTDKKCGDSMPQGSDKLPVADRDTIRRWIAQGAKND